jgi:hypothetical protein
VLALYQPLVSHRTPLGSNACGNKGPTLNADRAYIFAACWHPSNSLPCSCSITRLTRRTRERYRNHVPPTQSASAKPSGQPSLFRQPIPKYGWHRGFRGRPRHLPQPVPADCGVGRATSVECELSLAKTRSRGAAQIVMLRRLERVVGLRPRPAGFLLSPMTRRPCV